MLDGTDDARDDAASNTTPWRRGVDQLPTSAHVFAPKSYEPCTTVR